MTIAAAPAATPGVSRVRIHSLRVRDFRNLAAVDLTPADDGMVLVGENGHGKTNVLEALYYLQLFRSCRGARDPELVRFGAGSFHIAAAVHGTTASQVAAGFESGPSRGGGGRKRIRLDGAEPETIADAVGVIPAVLIAPRDAAIVAGSPADRRRFLDVMLSLASPAYLRMLQRYRAAMVRRNLALRAAQRGGPLDAVAAWEPALAQAGASLCLSRREWTAAAAPAFARLCAEIGERGTPAVRYRTAFEGADLEAQLCDVLERRRALHVRRGVTLDGPHRDELALELDGRELRNFGSAGQQRTAAIALRLLEAGTLRDAHNAEPMLLLDDPFAELDGRRAGRILELLAASVRGQTVLAVPREEEVPPHFTRLERFRVVHGDLRHAGR